MKDNHSILKVYAGMILVSALLGSVLIAKPVGAAAGSGTGPTGGSCDSAYPTTWDTCFGSSWRYYNLDSSFGIRDSSIKGMNTISYNKSSDSVTIPNASSNVKGGTISGCVAEHSSGFFMHGFEVYNSSTNTSVGYQAGLVAKSKGGPNVFGSGADYVASDIPADTNGMSEFIKNLPSGATFSDEAVAALFTFVETNGTNNGYSWSSPDLAWFCTGMLEQPGGFLSRSNVRIGSNLSDYETTDWVDGATALETASAGSGEEITVTFSHDLKYEGTLPNERVEIRTDWGYTVDRSGASSAQSIVADSNPVNWGTYIPIDNEVYNAVPSHTYTIKLPEVTSGSQVVTICETISYSPKTLENNALTGSGWSRACATITVSASPPPPQLSRCPIPGYEGTINYGNTVAQSGVRNSTQSSSWVNTSESNNTAFVWAKPGDSIQFQHTLCYGAQVVRGSGSSGGDRNIKPSKANTATIKAFTQPATSGANYLFGKTLTGNSSQSFTLDIGEARPSDVQGADIVGDYFFTYYSPSLKVGNSADSTYRCNAPGASNFKVSHYQILGYESTSLLPSNCNAASAVNAVSDVGKIIEQDLEWNNVKAYINEHETSSGGSCGCSDSIDEYAYATNAGNDYNGAKAAGSSIGHHVRYCYRDGNCGCCGEYCTACRAYYSLTDYWHYPISTTESTGTTQKAQVKVPYNYTTSFTLSTSQSRLYSGGEFGVNIQIHTNTRENSDVSDNAYATISKTSQYKIAAFVVGPSVGMNSVPGENERSTNSDICSYYNGGRDCEIVDSGSGIYFNPQGNLGGDTETVLNSGSTITVPDLEVGTKFCIAVGVYPSDSHDYTSGPAGSGDVALRDSGAYWHYSEPVCRTITKKPTVEFHTSGIFTYGDITTSQTKKMVGYSLGQYGSLYGSSINGGSRTVFGSWSEYEIMAQGTNSISDEQGMASGASFGGSGYPNVGLNSSVNPCTISTQSYANSGCSSSSIGNLSTGAFDDIILDRIISRYTDSNKAVNNSVTSIDLSVGTCNLVGSTYVASDAGAGYYCLDNGAKYYRVNNATIFGNIYGSNNHNNAIVVDAIDTVTISNDIFYKSYTGGDNFTNIADLPQLLIFADAIQISGNVKNVDAWLIAGQKSSQDEAGFINTCADVSPVYFYNSNRGGGAGICDKQLTINGPIFANTLYLNRTAGAGTGSASGDPAEIIRLRPDAYLWAYNQAQRFSQAVTTYSRELAPRY